LITGEMTCLLKEKIEIIHKLLFGFHEATVLVTAGTSGTSDTTANATSISVQTWENSDLNWFTHIKDGALWLLL
jgi:hypothetical protein